MKDKITLKEFFESKEKLAIHCDTEEKANKLLREFDKLGKKWLSEESYLQYNNFNDYNDKTCYSNYGEYCEIEFYKERDCKIYSFEEVIFEEEAKPKKSQLTKAERVILENLPKEYKWIARDARDAGDALFVYGKKPTKSGFIYRAPETYNCIDIFNHLFQFIKWKDEEPYNIEELLKGE